MNLPPFSVIRRSLARASTATTTVLFCVCPLNVAAVALRVMPLTGTGLRRNSLNCADALGVLSVPTTVLSPFPRGARYPLRARATRPERFGSRTSIVRNLPSRRSLVE